MCIKTKYTFKYLNYNDMFSNLLNHNLKFLTVLFILLIYFNMTEYIILMKEFNPDMVFHK